MNKLYLKFFFRNVLGVLDIYKKLKLVQGLVDLFIKLERINQYQIIKNNQMYVMY